MKFQTINPATGEVIQTYSEMTFAEVEKILAKTEHAFLDWRLRNFAERAKCIRKMVELLHKNKQQYAKLMTEEMGKPLPDAVKEIDKCAWACEHFAEHAEEYLKPRFVKTEMNKSYIAYEPQGIIFAIMPWNFPFWQVFRFAAPNIMGGNAAILKHSPNTTGCGLEIEKMFGQAGFPADLFRTIIVDNDIAAKVIQHPLIKAVTLTGSQRAGKTVGQEAASVLKKSVMELGGSDPYLILEDADLELAVEQSVRSRLSNSGQVCIAAKRMIVVDKIADEFEHRVVEKLKQFKMGNPMEEGVNFGPLAREDLRDNVHNK
jgi:succinate-semialdehyde dehydrogenase / glutarate-semialdehyde dehydrogenase